jgi:hypothetical protein
LKKASRKTGSSEPSGGPEAGAGTPGKSVSGGVNFFFRGSNPESRRLLLLIEKRVFNILYFMEWPFQKPVL